mmetsp:Transcript_51908/g.166169  ORF Transcript_51908/g.166169 Transcript_51908/m.166169 type:complete len:443 (-) Transcript_51908:2801-4129(-)
MPDCDAQRHHERASQGGIALRYPSCEGGACNVWPGSSRTWPSVLSVLPCLADVVLVELLAGLLAVQKHGQHHAIQHGHHFREDAADVHGREPVLTQEVVQGRLRVCCLFISRLAEALELRLQRRRGQAQKVGDRIQDGRHDRVERPPSKLLRLADGLAQEHAVDEGSALQLVDGRHGLVVLLVDGALQERGAAFQELRAGPFELLEFGVVRLALAERLHRILEALLNSPHPLVLVHLSLLVLLPRRKHLLENVCPVALDALLLRLEGQDELGESPGPFLKVDNELGHAMVHPDIAVGEGDIQLPVEVLDILLRPQGLEADVHAARQREPLLAVLLLGELDCFFGGSPEHNALAQTRLLADLTEHRLLEVLGRGGELAFAADQDHDLGALVLDGAEGRVGVDFVVFAVHVRLVHLVLAGRQVPQGFFKRRQHRRGIPKEAGRR